MGDVQLLCTFKRVSAIVTNDAFPHAVIQLTPVETHMNGKRVVVSEIKPTLKQMASMLPEVKNDRERQILTDAMDALKAALK